MLEFESVSCNFGNAAGGWCHFVASVSSVDFALLFVCSAIVAFTVYSTRTWVFLKT